MQLENSLLSNSKLVIFLKKEINNILVHLILSPFQERFIVIANVYNTIRVQSLYILNFLSIKITIVNAKVAISISKQQCQSSSRFIFKQISSLHVKHFHFTPNILQSSYILHSLAFKITQLNVKVTPMKSKQQFHENPLLMH